MGRHVTFRNAPLVEMMVELRWTSEGSFASASNAPGTHIIITAGNPQEEFFSEFGRLIAKHGFCREERLVPVGVSFLPYQAVYRFKHKDDSVPVVFQIGLNMFTANAVPPYKSWTSFSRYVSDGIATLKLASQNKKIKVRLHTKLMRYIDIFSGDLLRSMTPDQFIRETFGFRLLIPDALQKRVPKDGVVKGQLLQVTALLDNNVELTITAAESAQRGGPAALLDWIATIKANDCIDDDVDTIMHNLDRAQNVIHEMFMEIVKPIEDVLDPQMADKGGNDNE